MYTKLFGSIVHSTIWREPDHVRLVWITMLALSDKNGCVWVSVPGLADAARVTVEECRAALDRLSSPDPDSRTQVAEGRRVEHIDGGYWLINHAKFQAIKNVDERREQVREAVARHRAKKAKPVIKVITGNRRKPLRPDQTRPTQKAVAAAPREANGNSPGSILAAIKTLAVTNTVPGQATTTFIPKGAVQERFGPAVAAAIEAVGGPRAVLDTEAKNWGFLVRDFEKALVL